MRMLAPLPALLLLAASAAAQPLPAGRCDGASPAPAPPRGGKPLDFRASPILNFDRQVWEVLGYRVDEAGGRLLDSSGTALTEEELRFLEGPWDAAKEKLSETVWIDLMVSGYRLDESNCSLKGPDSKPISRLAVEYNKVIVGKRLTRISLERLLAAIRALPPDAPIPANVHAMIRQMSATGAPLPAEILATLQHPDATVARLRGPATATYEGLQRFFDGQIPLGDSLGLTVRADGGAARRRVAYRDSTEREFGRMLHDVFRVELSRNPVGADLFARFDRNHRNGTPNLLVLKLTQRPEDSNVGAGYDPERDTMVINHWTVAAVVRLRTPAEKRASVEPLLSDPAKLMAFVSKDPTLMKAVIAEIDIDYFHELLHADQSRRTRIDDEGVRGNAPWVSPLDNERETHREDCRYLFSKASYDPAAINVSRSRDYCIGMLRDPDAFQDAVTRTYLATFADSVTGPELLQMQEVRRAATGAPSDDWLQATRQALRRIGLRYGDEALADFDRDVRARTTAFNAGIAGFRDRTASLMAKATRTEPHLALLYLAIDPKWTVLPQAEASAAAAMRWVVANQEDKAKLDDSIAVVSLANAWLSTKKRPSTPEYYAAVMKVFRAAAAAYLQRALAVPPGLQREAAYDAAQAYASAVPENSALLADIRARRQER